MLQMQKKERKFDLHFNQNTARKHWACAFFQIKKELINNNDWLSVEASPRDPQWLQVFSSS